MKSFNEWQELNELTFSPELPGEDPYEGIRRSTVQSRLDKINKMIKEIARQLNGEAGDTGIKDIFKGTFGFTPLKDVEPKMANQIMRDLYVFSKEFAASANEWARENRQREEKIKTRKANR